MMTKFHVYRATWIFGCADAGMTVMQIKASESLLADLFSDELPVEEAVRLTVLSAQVEAG